MEMFDAHRRDIFTFDDYMDLKKPGFGGPASAIALRDARGKKINKSPKLDGYQRTVERDPAFSHPVYNSTYKAMTHDLVYKQENKKPFKYTDPYRTAVPVIEYDPTDEGKTYSSFDRFINEMEEKSLSQIENELRSYEGGYDEEGYEEFGANPDDDEDDKFHYIPGMPEELGMPDKETMAYLKQKASEFGANPRFR